jgi:benzylsuccinate CoA-transferase BbsF subunit
MAVGARSPHGLEGSDLFDALNCGKQSITLNLKHPDGNAIARRLIVEWAEAVSENFAPRAMKAFGLAYDDLAAERPDLVMLSACLNGQTGPHKDYPGFGGQGAALSGFNWLTGWPDRAPVGPFGTITDSLSPRFAATALAAALLRRRRWNEGCYLDISQVEAAIWSLTPWLLRYHRDGVVGMRNGNANPAARLHGVYPCAGDDRWVAVACWDDDHLGALAVVIGGTDEDALAAWTSTRSPLEAADALQAAGVEAVPVQDFGDVFADPQLAHRGHFERLDHPVLGPGAYERNGFRLDGAETSYRRPSPILGEDTDAVLGDILGLSRAHIEVLREEGALD